MSKQQIQLFCGIAPFPSLRGFIRDNRPMWLLEELGVEHELVYVDPSADAAKPNFTLTA